MGLHEISATKLSQGVTIMGWCPNKPPDEDRSEEARLRDIEAARKNVLESAPPHRLLMDSVVECADGTVIRTLLCGTCQKRFLDIVEVFGV